MKKQINIGIDTDKLTLWQAIKLRTVVSDTDRIEVKHENTGMIWIAIAIILSALIIAEVLS